MSFKLLFSLSYDDVRSLFDPGIFNIIRLVNWQIKATNWKYGYSVIKVGVSTVLNLYLKTDCCNLENYPGRGSRIFTLRSEGISSGIWTIGEAICDSTYNDKPVSMPWLLVLLCFGLGGLNPHSNGNNIDWIILKVRQVYFKRLKLHLTKTPNAELF